MYRDIQLNKVTLIVGVAILGLLMVSAAQATIIAEHTGSNDPLMEGFTKYGSGAAAADAGPPASWNIAQSATGQAWYGHTVTAADFSDPSGWTWTCIMKLDSDCSNISTAETLISNGDFRIDITSLSGAPASAPGMWVWSVGGSNDGWVARFGTVDPRAAFYTYQIYMDPHGAGTADDVFEMYLDGSDVGSFTRADVSAYATPLFKFGDGTADWASGGAAQRYALERLETGKHIIPEPSTLALLATGLIGLLCYAWRKRR